MDNMFLVILCVFCTVVIHIEGTLICPIGWDEFGNACYFFNHAARVDYEEAEGACNSFGANLTTIYSMEEQEFLASRLQDDYDRVNHFYYIGLNDKEVQDTFVWSDGTLLDGFSHWGSNQPNNDEQDCVALKPKDAGTWHDIRCRTAQAYICKRDKVSDTCVNLLGMKDRTIQDNQITASERVVGAEASKARLDGETAWSVGPLNPNQTHDHWIQVDFGKFRYVSGLVIQGNLDHTTRVTRYKVEYCDDGVAWLTVKDIDKVNDMIFYGNSDRDSYVTSLFPSTIMASGIRIRPTEWNGNYITMRMEILGCEVTTMTSITLSTSATMTIKSSIPYTTSKSLDARLSGKSNISAIATGVAIAFVLLLVLIGCIVFVVFKRRKHEQDSSQSQTAIQLDGPYGDTVTNAVTSQPKEDANAYEGVDHHVDTGASQIPVAADHGELYQDVPDRPVDSPVDHEDTYHDVRDAPTNSAGANDDIYHDIRDAEYDYARVDKKRLIQVPNNDSDHTTSHGNDAPRSGEANQQEGWVDNDIYGRSDEEQPKRQDDEDSNTEGWEDNSIYATSNE